MHNDTCYPALLVIGQLLDAIESGKYDIHKVALILPQTGGGCRASNYIHLLRKALDKNGYGFIPVISLNFAGLEADINPGFKLTKTMVMQIAYALLIGDLIMMVANQCRPYECVPGSTDKAIDICMSAVTSRFTSDRIIRYGEVKHLYRYVLQVFGKIKLDKSQKEDGRHRGRDLCQILPARQQPVGSVFALRGLRACPPRPDGLLYVLSLQLGHRP